MDVDLKIWYMHVHVADAISVRMISALLSKNLHYWIYMVTMHMFIYLKIWYMQLQCSWWHDIGIKMISVDYIFNYFLKGLGGSMS